MKLLSSSLMVGLCSSTATASEITYDCDTAANHFSELNLPAPGKSFKVSGFVQLNSIAESTAYGPIARIQIASSAEPGKSPDSFAGFSISAVPVKARKMASGASSIQMLSYNLKGKEDEVLPLSMLTKPGTVQPFSMSYDGANVSLDLGQERKSFPMETADPVVRIVCSTGEFLITRLLISAL